MAAYVQHDLGHCEAGTAVQVTPAQASNVYLLDAPNFGLYRRRRRFQGVGGPAASGATLHMPIPRTGRWFVVVDLGGTRGTIGASVHMLDPAAIDADVTQVVPTALTAEQLLRGGRR
jgi:hypothetical protein